MRMNEIEEKANIIIKNRKYSKKTNYFLLYFFIYKNKRT